MRFDLLFGILRSRFWLVASIVAVTTLTAIVGSLLMSKSYGAATTVYVDANTVDQVSGTAAFSRETIRNMLASQTELIQSSQVVNRVIKDLKLTQDPQVQADWQKATKGRGDITDWLATVLLKAIKVTSSTDGTTIAIGVEWSTAEGAADIANGFANAYKAAALELRTKPAQEYAERFASQVKEYKTKVEEAQTKLTKFQRESGIISSDERIDVENQRLQELSSQLVQVQSALSESRSRSNVVGRGGDMGIPEVVANELIQTLTTDLGRAEAKLGQVSAQYGSNHPAYLQAKAEVQELRTRRDTEVSRVKSSIRTANAVNTSREKELQAAVDAQKAKVLALRSKRDQVAILQQDLASAQKAYDLVERRLTETTVSMSAGLSNISVISPAIVPLLPSRPNLVLNVAVGLFLGLFLGMMAAFTLEAAQRPLRSADDLLQAAGIPVLAVLPPSQSTRAQRLIGGTGPSVTPPNLRLGN